MVKRTFQSGPTGVVAAGTGLIAITYGVVRYGFGLQLPTLAHEFSLASGVAGLVAAGSFAAYCVAALAAQRLIDRTGARSVLWLAALLAAAGATTVALATTTPALAAGVQKWLLRACSEVERWILVAAGALLIYPAPMTDWIGLALLAGLLAWQRFPRARTTVQ